MQQLQLILKGKVRLRRCPRLLFNVKTPSSPYPRSFSSFQGRSTEWSDDKRAFDTFLQSQIIPYVEKFGVLGNTGTFKLKSYTTVDVVKNLIRKKAFQDAYSYLKDAVSSRPPYVNDIALAILFDSILPFSAKIEGISAWFSLFYAHQEFPSLTSAQTNRLVEHDKLLNAVPVVLRYCEDSDLIMFFKKSIGANQENYNILESQSYSALNNSLALTTQHYNYKPPTSEIARICFPELCRSGRYKVLLGVLSAIDEARFKLDHHSCNFLLDHLQQVRSTYHDRILSILSRLDHRSSMSKRGAARDDIHEATYLETLSVALRLRHFKKVLTTTRMTTYVRIRKPRSFADFIKTYVSLRRNVALNLLFKKALRNGIIATEYFLFSEMLYYYHSSQYDLVIETFFDHFHLVAVPSHQVIEICNSLIRNRESGDEGRRLIAYEKGSVPKIWPSSRQITLVWDALFARQKEYKYRRNLYDELLSCSKLFSFPDRPYPLVFPAPEPRVFINYIEHNIFSGNKILEDMVKLGLHIPGVVYNSHLRTLANNGASDQVFSILKDMEKRKKLTFKFIPENDPDSPNSTPIVRNLIVDPFRLSTYLILLRIFTNRKEWIAAAEIITQILSRFPHMSTWDQQNFDGMLDKFAVGSGSRGQDSQSLNSKPSEVDDFSRLLNDPVDERDTPPGS